MCPPANASAFTGVPSLAVFRACRGILADDRVVARRELAVDINLFLVALVDLGDRDDMLVLGDAEDRHALGVAAHDADVADRGTDDLGLVGDQHQGLARGDREAGDDAAVALRCVDVGDALAAAIGAAIFVSAAALAVAVFGDGQEELLLLREARHSASGGKRALLVLFAPRRAFEIGFALFLGSADAAQDRHRDDLVAVLQADAANPGRGARLEFADVGRFEADRLAVARGEQDIVVLGQQIGLRSAGRSDRLRLRRPRIR